MRFIGDTKKPPDETLPKADNSDKTFSINIRMLKKGMKGGDVKALQRMLFMDGYSIGTAGDDGDFGSCTEKAVMNYQTDHKLDVDGIAGKQTFSELLKP